MTRSPLRLWEDSNHPTPAASSLLRSLVAAGDNHSPPLPRLRPWVCLLAFWANFKSGVLSAASRRPLPSIKAAGESRLAICFGVPPSSIDKRPQRSSPCVRGGGEFEFFDPSNKAILTIRRLGDGNQQEDSSQPHCKCFSYAISFVLVVMSIVEC